MTSSSGVVAFAAFPGCVALRSLLCLIETCQAGRSCTASSQEAGGGREGTAALQGGLEGVLVALLLSTMGSLPFLELLEETLWEA